MSNRHHPALADAYAPDATRDALGAPNALPDWLVHLLVTIILFLRTHLPHYRNRTVPDWWDYREDLPLGSVQQLAASIRGEFGNAIVWMCRRRGIGPGHPDWPELSRAIVAYGGSLQGFRPGLPACGLQWWENPNIVPGMIGMPEPTPAADAMVLLLALPAGPHRPSHPIGIMPAATEPTEATVSWRPVLPRAATGPPTGPPVVSTAQFCHACTHGAGPRPAPPS